MPSTWLCVLPPSSLLSNIDVNIPQDGPAEDEEVSPPPAVMAIVSTDFDVRLSIEPHRKPM